MNDLYNHDLIRSESEKVLIEHGLDATDASIVVDTMIEADMAGISTHGIRMLPSYVEKLGNGFFSKDKAEVLKSTASFSVVDAHGIIGALSAVFCTELAIAGAKKSGIYTVLSRNSNTLGAASYYTNKIAEHGLIGISFSNSPAAMPVANGAEPMLGTNPLAFSCPSKSHGTIMMDMATSVVAKSKFELYKQEGKELPEGWALNSNGKPTKDPVEGIKGLVLPMAGFKGYEIAMMIDIISGALSGAAYLNTVNKFYSATNDPMNVGHVFIAIDPTIVYGDDFGELMDEYVERVKSSKAVEGKVIILPGDRRKKQKEESLENGISLTKNTVDRLVKVLISGNATDIDFRGKFGRGGIEVVYHENEWDIVESPETYDIVVCNNLFAFNPIEKFAKIKFIQLTSAGLDRVPLEYIKQKGIRICNAKGVYDVPIAEFTIGRILEWYKQFREIDKTISTHKWEKQRNLQELCNKMVLIYGYGGIGHEIAVRLKSFGAKVIGVSRHEKSDGIIDVWRSTKNIDDVIEDTDILIITAPLNEDTRGIVNRDFLNRLKSSCLLVNVSRGAIVNTADLMDHVQQDKLAGAILDVFLEEPLPSDSPIWSCERILVSPHNSFEGEGNKKRLEEVIVTNIKEEVHRYEKS